MKAAAALKSAIEPQYMWIFKNLSKMYIGYDLIQEIQRDINDMFLKCPEICGMQRLALKQMFENIKAIQPAQNDVWFSRYVSYFSYLYLHQYFRLSVCPTFCWHCTSHPQKTVLNQIILVMKFVRYVSLMKKSYSSLERPLSAVMGTGPSYQ